MKIKPIVDQLLGQPESNRLEFVSRADAFDQVARNVCAMLNSDGGAVLVGVSENGGIDRSMSEQDADRFRSYLHENITPKTLFTVTVDETRLGNVVTVDVPVGEDRPYVFDGAVFVRRGAQTAKADAATLRRLVQDRAAVIERWERRISSGVSMGDLDEGLIRETVRRATDKRGYQFRDPRDHQQVLAELGLMINGQLTNASDVVFGKGVSVRQPQTRLRAVCYRSDRADDFLDEQLLEGAALVLLQRAMAFLERNVRISSEFKEGKLERVTRPQYPFNSLREGLVNALVHRDYTSFSGSVSLSIYPDRVEIWNTGQLPDGVLIKDLARGSHRSVLVNPDISHAFYLHELMERVGRGTFNIIQECRASGMSPPKWQQDSAGVSLTFFGLTGKENAIGRLNSRQTALLESLKVGEMITLREYLNRYAGEVTERQARRDMAALERAGLLSRIGKAAATVYRRLAQGGSA